MLALAGAFLIVVCHHPYLGATLIVLWALSGDGPSPRRR
jgi:hypothetical protein